MDKKNSFFFLLIVSALFLFQPLGFAKQDKLNKTTEVDAPPSSPQKGHDIDGLNSNLAEKNQSSIDNPELIIASEEINSDAKTLDAENNVQVEKETQLAKEQLQQLERLLEKQQQTIANLQHIVDEKNVLEEKLQQQKNLLAEEKLVLEQQRIALIEQQRNAEQQTKTLNSQITELNQQKQILDKQQKSNEKKKKQLDAVHLANEQKIQQQQNLLQTKAENLAVKEKQTEEKLKKIEEHWLTKVENLIDKYFGGSHGYYLIAVLILFFLPFLFLLRSRKKQKLSQLPPEQEKDYVGDNREGDGRRRADNKTEFGCESAPPVVQVVEVDGQKIMDRRAARPHNNVVANKPLIWITIIAIPLLLYFYMIEVGVHKEVAIYSGIVAITLIMWMSSLLPEFIPALIGLLLVLLFGLAPNDIVLSGFSSPGFLLLFSVMGLGAVITSSGLTKRYTLWLIKSIPSNLFANQFAIFLTGLVFNPIVPTINGRAMIVAPILRNIVGGWDEKAKKQSATPLYASGLDGINFLSPIFLTAAPANLMIYGLLPSQEQQSFEFMFWIYAASIVGLVMFLLYFLVSALFFRSFTSVQVSKEDVEAEWRNLGSFTWCEWIALTGIILMAVGIATSSIHKVPIPLITFGVLCAVLVIGVLSRDQFIKQIDWSFLVLLASMIGILATMSYLGIEKTLVTQFSWLGEYMRNDFHMFVLVLTGMILLVRIFIPLNSAILIFAAALLPLATGAGVSAWVVGFIILIMCGTAFFGYQSPYILYFRSLLKGEVPFVDLKYQIFQILLVFVKLAAIYASIPFWTKIGVL